MIRVPTIKAPRKTAKQKENQSQGSLLDNTEDFGEMIAHALNKLPHQRGTLKAICDVINTDIKPSVAGWRGSVRKALCSNPRFAHQQVIDRSEFMFAASEATL